MPLKSGGGAIHAQLTRFSGLENREDPVRAVDAVEKKEGRRKVELVFSKKTASFRKDEKRSGKEQELEFSS